MRTTPTARHGDPPPALTHCGDWFDLMASQLASDQLEAVLGHVERERNVAKVYPPRGAEFAALVHTSPSEVRVVILGQDPYHGPCQADGLAFSVPRGVRSPPSLANILKESEREVARPRRLVGTRTGAELPASRGPPRQSSHNGVLLPWAQQGVLLLNTVLTVRDGEPLSHRKIGWQAITGAILKTVAALDRPVVFALFGRSAAESCAALGLAPEQIVERSHPSPLSAHRGFLGTRPFAAINDALVAFEMDPIDWSVKLG